MRAASISFNLSMCSRCDSSACTQNAPATT
jgi:hypothetical protein